MSKSFRAIKEHLGKIHQGRNPEQILEQMRACAKNLKPKVPPCLRNSSETVNEIWKILNAEDGIKELIYDAEAKKHLPEYNMNIENFIGTVKVPVGLAGPLRVNGSLAQGDFYIPMATTEAALVASYSRGAQLITESGGCTAFLLSEGVSRAPVFGFPTLREALSFTNWCLESVETFKQVAESTTRFGKLIDLKVTIEGNRVYLTFEYSTGDAAGQNMVTIATEAVMKHIKQHTPITPVFQYVESNMSGDKKATSQAFQGVRGKKVSVDVVIPKELLKQRMDVTPEELFQFCSINIYGAIMSGMIGIHGHLANALAAIYMACGQDVACVSESSVGLSRCEVTPEGDLYVSVTMPNLIVGTVGGGTSLPTQKACLDILGLAGAGSSGAFAEVVAGAVLAGELSLSAAICSGHFTRAHDLLARVKKTKL